MRAALALLALSLAIPATARAQTVEVPFHQYPNGLISIPCKTDIGNVLPCILDTGSTMTIADSKAVGDLPGPQVLTHTVAGSRYTRLVRTFVEVAGTKIPCTVGATDGLHKAGIDVLLGQDILLQFSRVTFDYSRGVVIFEKRDRP